MTSYSCVICGAGGGSGRPDNESPMSYHCHYCNGRGTMWYRPHAEAYRELAASKRVIEPGDLRDLFELTNPIPEGVIRYMDGYIPHTIGQLSPAFSFIKAGEFIAKFAGFKEGRVVSAQPLIVPAAEGDGQ